MLRPGRKPHSVSSGILSIISLIFFQGTWHTLRQEVWGERCLSSNCIPSCLPSYVWGWSFQLATVSVPLRNTKHRDTQESVIELFLCFRLRAFQVVFHRNLQYFKLSVISQQLLKLYRWTNQSCHSHSNVCDIRTHHRKALLWAHFCRRCLALSLLQAFMWHTSHLKWRGYLLRYHFFLTGQTGRCFFSLSAIKPPCQMLLIKSTQHVMTTKQSLVLTSLKWKCLSSCYKNWLMSRCLSCRVEQNTRSVGGDRNFY